jgi:hypothetical protein
VSPLPLRLPPPRRPSPLSTPCRSGRHVRVPASLARRRFVSGDDGGAITVWSAESLTPIAAFEATGSVTGWGGGGETVATVWDTLHTRQHGPRRPRACDCGCRHPVTSLLLRDTCLVASFTSGHIRVYKAGDTAATCYLQAEVAAHARCITAMHMHPNQYTVRGRRRG